MTLHLLREMNVSKLDEQFVYLYLLSKFNSLVVISTVVYYIIYDVYFIGKT